MSLNPLVTIVRFGFAPRGSVPAGGSTDFRHEFHFLSGLPNHMIRFGRQPVGTSGGGPVVSALPHNRQFLADVGRLMGR